MAVDTSTLKLEIDDLKLPEEWIAQPLLMMQWGAKKADADREVAEAKSTLDVVKANLDLDIRNNPEAYGLAKVTESALAAAMLADPQYAKTLKKLNDAKHAADIVAAAVVAIGHRKSALQALVDLHATAWFSQPRARHADPLEVENAGQKASFRKAVRPRREDNSDE